MFKLGDSNPEPTTQQLNQVGDSAPLEGKANGSFSRSLFRYLDGDSGSFGSTCRSGSMAPFKKRSPILNPPNFAILNKRYPNPIAQPHYLNEISHLLATRGNADGSIEHF